MSINQAYTLASNILPEAKRFEERGGTFAIRVRIREVIELCNAVIMLTRKLDEGQTMGGE